MRGWAGFSCVGDAHDIAALGTDRNRRASPEDAMTDLLLSQRDQLERLCDVAGRLGLAQLPLFRAAADGLLALISLDAPSTPWPAKLIERYPNRPTVFLLGGDPGFGHSDPAPSEWMCGRRLKYWCRAAVVHGAGGEPAHYRQAVPAALLVRRLAFVETTSRRASEWAEFLDCPLTHVIVPVDGVHPVAATARPLQ